jgi:hypothetical protein
MCGTIIEVLFLVAGFWLIVSGKIPDGLFKVMFGKGRYVLRPTKARLFGLLLASPLPVVLLATILISRFVGEDSLFYSILFETGYVIIIAIIAIIVARRIKLPEQVT